MVVGMAKHLYFSAFIAPAFSYPTAYLEQLSPS